MTTSRPYVREPAVAGHFYRADAAALRAQVRRCLGWGSPEAGATGGAAASAGPAPASCARAVVVPHAGYDYSGGVAGAVYAAARLPRTLVILCPNHTGHGRPIAVGGAGVWRTPLGEARVDEPLSRRILEACPGAEVDDAAHRREHSLEVQLPFLQVTLDEFVFVPICVGTGELSALEALGRGLGRILVSLDEPAALVISTDMSHYISAGEAREKDMMAVERILALDPEGLHRVVRERDISMCGVSPAVAGLAAARAAGATEARLLAYATSGDVTGDLGSVVGYAGLVVT